MNQDPEMKINTSEDKVIGKITILMKGAEYLLSMPRQYYATEK
jgi:hypothetical protein